MGPWRRGSPSKGAHIPKLCPGCTCCVQYSNFHRFPLSTVTVVTGLIFRLFDQRMAGFVINYEIIVVEMNGC